MLVKGKIKVVGLFLIVVALAGIIESSYSSDEGGKSYNLSTEAWGVVSLSVKECSTEPLKFNENDVINIYGIDFYLGNEEPVLGMVMNNKANGSLFIFSSKNNKDYGMTIDTIDESVDSSKFEELLPAFRDAIAMKSNKYQSYFLRDKNILYKSSSDVIWVDQFHGGPGLSRTTIIFKNENEKRVQVALFPARGCSIRFKV
jgi:hypothetical protein